MLTAPNGDMVVKLAALSAAGSLIKRLIIGVSAEAEAKFSASDAIQRAFSGSPLPPAEIVLIAEPTAGPAQTVLEMINQAKVSGAVAIKDGDTFFDPVSIPVGSFIAVCDLQEMPDITAVGEKSFVLLTEQMIVDQIKEKNVCSNLISVGLYGVSDVEIFFRSYKKLLSSTGSSAGFISHVVSQSIDDGEIVFPLHTSGFVDVSEPHAWQSYRHNRRTIVLDIDGVVFENHSLFFSPYWDDDDKPIHENVNHLLKLQQKGAQFIFMTSRPEKYRAKTLASLVEQGLRVHALVTGCAHAQRCIVNDFASSNPFPTASAINIERNAPSLSKFI
jgi:hypothetical protein